MVIFTSFKQYIDSRESTEARIAAIDAIIDSLISTSLNAAENGDTTEYYLDTGQSKITYKYRNPRDVAEAINIFEGVRQRYIRRLNGGVVRNIPEQNLRYGRP